jgi:Rieske Fe-S protein
MERRRFLRWAVHGLGAVFGAVLGFPAVAYLIDPRNRPARQTGFRPVARVSELQDNVPKEVVIRETRRDAWTLHPDDVVGRIWLIRRPLPPTARPGAEAPPAPPPIPPPIDAFNTTCPHLGCSVNFNRRPELPEGGDFLCPCHGAHFRLDGTRIDPRSNPALRSMDSLNVRLDPAPVSPGAPPDWVILVEYQKFKTNQAAKEPIA